MDSFATRGCHRAESPFLGQLHFMACSVYLIQFSHLVIPHARAQDRQGGTPCFRRGRVLGGKYLSSYHVSHSVIVLSLCPWNNLLWWIAWWVGFNFRIWRYHKHGGRRTSYFGRWRVFGEKYLSPHQVWEVDQGFP